MIEVSRRDTRTRVEVVLNHVPSVLSDRTLARFAGYNPGRDWGYRVTRHQLIGSDPISATVHLWKD